MAASDGSTGRTHEAELARHITSGEATAFVTKLLGLLNAAEAAQHRSEHEPELPASELTPPHPTEAAPTELLQPRRAGAGAAAAAGVGEVEYRSCAGGGGCVAAVSR